MVLTYVMANIVTQPEQLGAIGLPGEYIAALRIATSNVLQRAQGAPEGRE